MPEIVVKCNWLKVDADNELIISRLNECIHSFFGTSLSTLFELPSMNTQFPLFKLLVCCPIHAFWLCWHDTVDQAGPKQMASVHALPAQIWELYSEVRPIWLYAPLSISHRNELGPTYDTVPFSCFLEVTMLHTHYSETTGFDCKSGIFLLSTILTGESNQQGAISQHHAVFLIHLNPLISIATVHSSVSCLPARKG